MNKVTVTISRDDLFSYRLLSPTDTIEMFGEDYLEDYGIEIPSELLAEYKELMKKYDAMQQKLKFYKNLNDRN